jgi:hypothetical protein
MKKPILSILTFLSAMIIVSGCSKSNSALPSLQGTYSGQISGPGSVFNLQLTDHTYEGIYTGSQFVAGKGSYTVSGDKITFTDSLAHTALQPSVIYLSGTYSFTLKGDSLLLAPADASGFAYRLKKQ